MEKRKFKLSLIFLQFLSLSSIVFSAKLNLNADRSAEIWFVKNANNSISIPATIPGGIYSDLEAANIFSTPIYYRYNDLDTKWVGRENWEFSRSFEISEEELSKERVVLVCEGLDTISTVYINGIQVGESHNMFVRYIFDIKSALQIGQNKIRVQFKSPVIYAKEQYDRYDSEGHPILPTHLTPTYRGEDHANLIRKFQASFAWDWGPSYASSGIWKNIYVESYNNATIRDVMVFSTPDKTPPDETTETIWTIIVKAYIEASHETEEGTLEADLETTKEKIRTSKRVVLKKTTVSNIIELSTTFTATGEQVKLWWPNGYGDQPLYNLNVKYTSDAGETSELSKRIGFRTIKIDESQFDSEDAAKGNNFRILVNELPIYVKGTNFIPPHVLIEKANKNTLDWIFSSAKEAHSNMMRIWGGGIYQSEDFYDLADEYGIMIWQDFMFACSMYPASQDYLQNVLEEVDHQVKRLQTRTSIALWSTNNENEVALRQNWYGTSQNFEEYKRDYIALYIDTIKTHTEKLDTSRWCLPSSPSNLKKTEDEDWVANDPQSELYGDIHYFEYWIDGWDWKSFRKPRFASEYGFQSWPSPAALKDVTDPSEDWSWFSEMAIHRQRHPEGKDALDMHIRDHLPYPADALLPSGFQKMLYMTQITQSMSIKTETEHFRRWKGLTDSMGRGHNYGAMYWQINDIWPGPSWASIDYYGRWKMLHHYSTHFFNPIILSPFILENNDTSIHIISDSRDTFSGTARARLFHLNNKVPVKEFTFDVNASPFEAKEAHLIAATDPDFSACENIVSICLLYLQMDGVPDNFLLYKYPTDSAYIIDPNLRITDLYLSEDRKTVTINLAADNIALYVFLTYYDNNNKGRFSDNGFIMVDSTKTVTYTSRTNLNLRDFWRDLDIRSLFNAI